MSKIQRRWYRIGGQREGDHQHPCTTKAPFASANKDWVTPSPSPRMPAIECNAEDSKTYVFTLSVLHAKQKLLGGGWELGLTEKAACEVQTEGTHF